ncbi:MAG: transporter substrate-binding domain-containing protein [Desulfosarcinaceae bacterium]|nr:transporter substrate-binding domain-containing protein [Desulfosarcinaceae bacterium]
MQRMAFVTILVAALFSAPIFAHASKIVIHIDDDYRPFSYVENGSAKGIYVEILKTAFARLDDFDVEMVPVPWKRGKLLMEKGQGFGLMPVFFHGHDWPYLYPYSLPFYTETIVAICRAPVLDPPRKDWPEDYAGLRIGNVTGFDGWGGEAFRAMVADGRIHYEESKGSRSNILKLIYGRVDCIMMEQTAFALESRKLLAEEKVTTAQLDTLQKGATIGKDPVYIGYSKPTRINGYRNREFDFMQALDAVLYRMHKSGEIDEILRTYQY